MSKLSARLVKLEASSMLNETDPMRIARFIVTPGNLDPRGYSCEGVEVVRELGESTEALRKRCHDAVTWLDFNHSYIFYPLD